MIETLPPPLTPSAEGGSEKLKKLSLMLLSTAMSLSLSESMTLEEIETMIRSAALKQPLPEGLIFKRIAFDFGIEFNGDLIDCFGFHDPVNQYCIRCKDNAACAEFVLKSSLGGIAAPAIKQFGANDAQLTNRVSPPPKKMELHGGSKPDSKPNNSNTDRETLISWLAALPYIFPRKFKSSISFLTLASHENVLKLEQFTPKCYYVYYPKCTSPELGNRLGLESTAYGYRSTSNDLAWVQQTISLYFEILNLSMQVEMVRDVESFKTDLIETIRSRWGLTVELKKEYEVVIDKEGYRIIYLEKFSHRSYNVRFVRMEEGKAAALNLKSTSYGYSYNRANKQEVIDIITENLNWICKVSS
jgi:hypothetical protein